MYVILGDEIFIALTLDESTYHMSSYLFNRFMDIVITNVIH